MRTFSILFVAALLVGLACADMYMHNPPGANCRNRERSDNRNNGNRLFDSQNNGKGGYAWRGDATMNGAPDPLEYYSGSILRIEWTNQHACGPNDNLHCQVVIQYACEDTLTGLRDGYPTGEVVAADDNNAGYLKRRFSGEAGQNQDGTNTIPENQYANDPAKRAAFYNEGKYGGVEYGYHESIEWYDLCKTTQRNKGLYAADQNLNGNSAKYTRQNNNGARRGLECPEERDYYPYWRPAPWRDVAILTSSSSHCDYLTDRSQNVVKTGYCECDDTCRNSKENNNIPITQEACETGNNPGTWRTTTNGGGKPACRVHNFGRDNHLGNTAPVNSDGGIVSEKYQPETAHYNWKIPSQAAGQLCVVRVRYNISTMDYPSMAHASSSRATRASMLTSAHNCKNSNLEDRHRSGDPNAADLEREDLHCVGVLTKDVKPLFNRPYIRLFGSSESAISIALNTNQASRTFQDRSHVFRVGARPSWASGKTIYNLNTRGRRGNIVQSYPAVEYDFVPSKLDVNADDIVHIQFHGSNFNAAKNANNGEGWQYSDRMNMVQLDESGTNMPRYRTSINLFRTDSIAKRFALLEQTGCGTYYNGKANEQNAYDNCAKLNKAPARFPALPEDGLMYIDHGDGTYKYGSTRNNNFSNRSQKASLRVGSGGLTLAEKAAIGVGVTVAVGLAAFGLLAFGKKKPDTCCGTVYTKLAGVCGGSSAKSMAAAPPDMEYARH